MFVSHTTIMMHQDNSTVLPSLSMYHLRLIKCIMLRAKLKGYERIWLEIKK